METELGRRTFQIGDPVVVTTDRPLKGYVTGIEDIPHVGVVDLAPQVFQGQKGWVFSLSCPVAGGVPISYEVAFRVQGTPRKVVIHQWIEEAGILSEERQLNRGRGHLWQVRPEDLAPDVAPNETFDALMNEMYEAGEFDLDPVDVLHKAEHFLDARQAARDPEGYLARHRAMVPQLAVERPDILHKSLENHQADWQHFQERGASTITEYIRSYIEAEDAGRLDWTPILSAVEQAERGERTALETLLENVYVSGREILPLAGDRLDPGVPTTACFDCDAVVPVADSYVSKRGLALCESCFLKREARGHARRRNKPFPRDQA